MAQDQFSFQSINKPGFFIRHRNFVGQLSLKNDGPLTDFAFQMPLRDPDNFFTRSFQAVNPNLGKEFRHFKFQIRLEDPPARVGQIETLRYLLDSTFIMEPGLAPTAQHQAGTGLGDAVSFRSFNFPDRFLRHRDFLLFVEPKDSPNLAADATFIFEFASVNIDPGTVVVPAED
jgi:hypothetical protein